MTRVKVCGLTRAADVRDAAALGAWALGAVLSESPRRVAPPEAARLFALAPPGVLTVAVFTTESAAEVAAAAAMAGAGAVQLSAGADGPSVAAVRRELLAAGITAPGISPAGATAPGISLPAIIAAADTIDADQADYVLLDSRLDGAGADDAPATAAAASVYGGTGQTLDWRSIQAPAAQSLVLAGGLTAANVGAAIAAARPFAVDVSSGVEQAPGVKDARLLRRLFAAVRAADDQADRGDEDRCAADSDRMDDRQS